MKKLNVLLIIMLCSSALFAEDCVEWGDENCTNETVCADDIPQATIYEFPNYTGRSVTTDIYSGMIRTSLPFPSNDISIRIPNGYQMLVKTNCDPRHEFPAQLWYHTSKPSLRLPGGLCEAKLYKKALFHVALEGIVTNVHNNDCKKVYGNITYSASGTYYPNGTGIHYTGAAYLPPFAAPSQDGKSSPPLRLMDFTKDRTNRTSLFVYNYLPNTRFDWSGYSPKVSMSTPSYSRPFSFFVGDPDNAVTFNFGVNLASAHKGCDLCTDFTWNSKMATTEYKSVTASFTNGESTKNLYVGPFKTSDGRHDFMLQLLVTCIR
jgi:hypothetical protein